MEGPSLVILKEEVKAFKGKRVLQVKGYSKFDHKLLKNQVLKDFKTWGKHFLLCFKTFTLRIHFGLFGNYRINDSKKGSNPTIGFVFSNGELNCYVAHVKLIEEPLKDVYDWKLDMLSPKWDPAHVKQIVEQEDAEQQVGDLLLNADIFSGVGNIIRNEVLYRCKTHPESELGSLPPRKLSQIIRETHRYSLDFLRWRKKDEMAKHWEVYSKKQCPLGHEIEKKYTGKTKRRSYICSSCMKKY